MGVLYGAFEVYKDYMDMKNRFNRMTPDLSGMKNKSRYSRRHRISKHFNGKSETLIVSQETVIGALKETINRVDSQKHCLLIFVQIRN